ncbi:hypothetical protein BN159_1176 [Streptomyces davaonensis JCM 4913]|uniref:LRV domain-containing protein n=1 Tax=Streptomyces davaonensis (strain DSM 101723 / JCM 4913 / KCC S-0913 / 768) TaxID=1214101 RepID=K4QXI9_STRDJ|nr:hypothetical protein [Streptomyces davaonensis]CCK25555.1 hypothetical protein BN159_1176 [Streptomyces davaonensis JCM 4913]
MTARDAVPGLAANASAPADVLLRLVPPEHDWDIVTRLVYRKSLPAEVGEALLTHPDRRVRSALAEGPQVDPELRARLLDGPASDAICVAVGPTPYRATVAPLPAWAYERLLSHERHMVRHETALSAHVPVHVLVPLATHEDWVLRKAACRRVWSELPDDVRTALLDDPDHEVRKTAALHVMHEDAERTAWLVDALDEWQLGDVLESGLLTRDLAERMMGRADDRHLNRLALNPTFPADLAARLADHEDPRVRLAVSARPELTEDQRAAIDWTVGPEDRLDPLTWVWRSRGDEDVLRRCAHSAHTWLRRSAAICAELPEDCVQLLADDEDFAVRLLLAEWHPKAPPELLYDLYLHGTHRAVYMLTSRPQFPSAGLAARCADAEDPRERALALRDPDASPSLVERLSRDVNARVREAAAFDPRLPLPRLVELLNDPHECSAAAAANPSLPVAEMRALLDRAGVPELPTTCS